MEAIVTWTHGEFFWNELNTRDAAAAKTFYETTLGWTITPTPMPGFTYWLIKHPKDAERAIGGIFQMTGPEFDGVPEHWLTYIAVDDVDARAKKAVAAGGKLMRPAMDIPQVGRMVLIMQPGGAMISWMTPAV
jgi:hypothetical protein